jgi:hypothetical protein
MPAAQFGPRVEEPILRFTLPTTSFALALVGLSLLPSAAAASPNQYALFQDDALLVEHGAAQRTATLNEVRNLGVDMIKVQLNWASAAPRGRRKPSGFDATDPSEYPGWAGYDAVLADAKARGLKVMFALAPPAPGWATRGTRRDRAGVNRPDALEFGRFAEAAARRFPGVDVWTIWNEPNHPGHLYPQSVNGQPVAPRLYHALVQAAARGLKRGGVGHDPVLFGELLPIGKSSTGPKRNLKPLRFLRAFFSAGKRLTGVDGFAYHPYTRPAGPFLLEPSPDDATIRSYGRVGHVLDSARARGRVAGKRLPIWNTEFGFQTNPPDPFIGAPIARVPYFWSVSELWFSYPNRRIKSISQYTMNDTPGGPSLWQSGLRFANGTPKTNIYNNFRLPILVRQLGPGAVEVRGDARPGGAGSVVQVQQRGRHGGFKDLGGPIQVRNVRGYFTARYRISKAARRNFRFLSGGLTSLAVKPVGIFR